MEKSIESIWKTGFLQGDALIAPKVNDLYNQKSHGLMARFRYKFRLNIILIIVMAVGFLIGSIFAGVPLAGILLAVLFMVILYVGKVAMRELAAIDNNLSSYTYLKEVDRWLRHFMSLYSTVYRIFYPLVLLVSMFGFYHSDMSMDSRLKVAADPDIMTLFGYPLYFLITTAIMALLLIIFSGKVYRFDMRLSYGGEFRKLRELISDMETLSKD